MTFDSQIQSITQDEIVPTVTDQTLGSNVLTLLVLSQGKPWVGESLKFPIKVSNHTQGGSFDDYSEFKIANENVRTTAAFDPRAYYQSCVIGGIARSVNAISKTQLLNLVKVEMESIGQDMVDGIGSLSYGVGTGKDFHGIGAAIDDGTTVDVYGGISRASQPKWKSDLLTSVGAFDFSKARSLQNKATTGNQKPRVWVCDETTFGYVESDYAQVVDGNYTVTEAARGSLTKNGMMPQSRSGLTGQAGFDALYYAGTPIVKDEKSPSGKIIALNNEYYRWYGVKAAEANPVDLKAMYHEGNDSSSVPSSDGFAWTGFVRPANQYAWIGQYLLIGNYICNAPRLQSVASGVNS